MTDRKRNLEHTSEPTGPLRRVVLDEPLGVWVSSCEPNDVDAALSAWDEPENGEFHECPRGPDDFYPHPEQATEERTKQGEDR